MTVNASDRNGLELTPAADTMNAYRLTAVNTQAKKFAAYAAGTRKSNSEFNMFTIGFYGDPRDAAYVAQQFEKKYSKSQVREMVVDGTFAEVAKEFRSNIDIPEWVYPAEGMTIDEMLNTTYKRNYVLTAREALVEAINVFKKPVPSLKDAAVMIKRVEAAVKEGMTLRAAAAQVIGA
jgi:hypothetical protein